MASEAENRANMVLRTVYLPRAVDSELRRMAFDLQKSKGEIIRECVRLALEVHNDEMFSSENAQEEDYAAADQEEDYAAAAHYSG